MILAQWGKRAILLVVPLVVLAACGGGGNPTATIAPTTPATRAATPATPATAAVASAAVGTASGTVARASGAASVAAGRYTDPQGRFAFAILPGWTVSPPSQSGNRVVQINPPSPAAGQVTVDIFDAANVGLDQLVQTDIVGTQVNAPTLRMTPDGLQHIPLGGKVAATYTLVGAQEQKLIVVQRFICVNNLKEYVITFAYDGTYGPVFNEARNSLVPSFTFTP